MCRAAPVLLLTRTVPKVAVGPLARRRPQHRPRQRAKRPLHQRQVLDLIMRREEERARPQLGEDTAH